MLQTMGVPPRQGLKWLQQLMPCRMRRQVLMVRGAERVLLLFLQRPVQEKLLIGTVPLQGEHFCCREIVVIPARAFQQRLIISLKPEIQLPVVFPPQEQQ